MDPNCIDIETIFSNCLINLDFFFETEIVEQSHFIFLEQGMYLDVIFLEQGVEGGQTLSWWWRTWMAVTIDF